jgi:iron(III) transport system ATP-binding protein
MTNISIEGLTKRFAGKPPTTAMDDLSLEVNDGEFVVLLGPSGCGKTTTLRCLAGLETPDAGRIRFGADVVFDSSRKLNLSPDRRSIGMVFQSYALWPHMTVRKNIAYPIKARKLSKVAAGWIEDTADLVDCGHLLDRYPAQLSGGQQQRVALARGIVARPDVVLFDEPLSNLDARLRDSVRAQLHELHARLQFSAVFVTHDQAEALALADKVVIMRAGRFEQVGTPEEIFESPATEYVADFIGLSNKLPLRRVGADWQLGDVVVSGVVGIPAEQSAVNARLRPEDIALAPTGADLAPSLATCRATVVDSQFGGRHIDVVVLVHDQRVHARVRSDSYDGWVRRLARDDDVVLAFDPTAPLCFDGDERRVVCSGQRVHAGVAG